MNNARFPSGKVIYLSSLIILLIFYIYKILSGAGGDLELRVSESKYFIHGIDPYLVYVKAIPPIPEYGLPNSYSFISYILMLPLTLVSNTFLRKLIYAILDVTLIHLTLQFIGNFLHFKSHKLKALVVFFLLISVFFQQHVNTLNYNIFATFIMVLFFRGEQQKSESISIISLVLLCVKPTFAIPVFLYSIILRRWKIFFVSSLILTLLLLAISIQIHTSPLDIIKQLADTKSSFSNGYTDGIFLFVKPFIGENITFLGIAVSFFTILFLPKKQIKSPIIALFITLGLGITLFYNHVHTWISVYPILYFSLITRKNKYIDIDTILLLLFMCLPRLVDNVPLQYRYYYVVIHNLIRFSILYLAIYLCSVKYLKKEIVVVEDNELEK